MGKNSINLACPKSMKKIITIISVCSLWLFLSSCSKIGLGSSVSGYQAYDRPAKLPTNPSAVRVKVSLSKQMIYVMEGSTALMVAPCNVGTASARTPSGNFRIFAKEQYKRANSHGWAYNGSNAKKCTTGGIPSGWSFKGTPMPYWCEFKTNYGFHTGWVKHYPSSHGCIRMHENISPKFFRLVKVGTPVSIAYTQAEDSTLGKGVPLAADAGPLPDYNASMYTGNGYFSRHKAPTFE
jgi:hypothetical protein